MCGSGSIDTRPTRLGLSASEFEGRAESRTVVQWVHVSVSDRLIDTGEN